MRRHFLPPMAFAAMLMLPTVVWAAPFDLTYTVIGTGGLSAPQANVSDSEFWWIDSTGTAPATDVAALGFEPFPAFTTVVDEWGFGGGGSLLLSSSFSLGAGETLEVSFELLTGRPDWGQTGTTAPNGFVLLLSEGQSPVVLANTTGQLQSRYLQGDQGDPQPGSQLYLPDSDKDFAPISPGVTVTAVPGHPIGEPQVGPGADVTLGAFHYWNDPLSGGDCGCYLDVTSTYTPGGGTYQLLFGIYDLRGVGGQPSIFRDGALAVSDVRSVPEPATMMLLGLGFAGLGLFRRRRHP